MKNFVMIALLTASVLTLGACTTREVATGAAAGAAGYVLGHESRH